MITSCLFLVMPAVENITNPSDTLLEESVTLLCLATGSPVPNITWQQDGNDIVSSGDRINTLAFFPRAENDTVGFEGDDMEGVNENISEIVMMVYAEIDLSRISAQRGLAVVSALSIGSAVRGDTGNYTCSAINQLSRTREITTTSRAVPLVILGKAVQYPPSHIHTYHVARVTGLVEVQFQPD